MRGSLIVRLAPLVLPLLFSAAGCQHKPIQAAPSGPTTVSVAQPVRREVINFVEFTGRTDAPFSVDVRARVTGYLVKMPFKEGSEVKTGDLLFEIDPRPYQAQLDRDLGQVKLTQAQLKLAQADLARAQEVAKTPGAISQQELDKYIAQVGESAASVEAAKANAEYARLNLEFCKVTSPINGQISRYFFTLGNLVNQDQTLLTTIVSQDPIYVYFDVDERTMLKVIRNLMAERVDPFTTRQAKVYMGLSDEEGFPHEGYVDFSNNKVDPLTGTITVRGVFANPASDSGVRLLRPGMFVRVNLPISKPYSALLVADQAIGTDQGQKFLYIVENNKVQYRRISPGPEQSDGLRVIANGLKEGEWVIISGLQFVRPGMEVQMDKVAMPVRATTATPTVPAPSPPKSPSSDSPAKNSEPSAAPKASESNKEPPPTDPPAPRKPDSP